MFVLRTCEIPIFLLNHEKPINISKLSRQSGHDYRFTYENVKKMEKFNIVNLSKNGREFLVNLTGDGKEVAILLRKIYEVDLNGKRQT